jgi:hypothetical protein
MMARIRARMVFLLAGAAVGLGVPSVAQSGPALYTASVHLRLWERAVPYGASSSQPGLGNSASGDAVSLVGTGPAAFALPPGQLSLATSLFDLSTTLASWDFRSTMLSGANAAGSFSEGAAPSAAGFTPVSSIPGSQFGATFSGAPNRFGGVMKLLGDFSWRGELASCSYCSYITRIPLSAIGGPFGGTATATTYVGGTANFTFVSATVWGFPWDTGTVGAVAAVPGTYAYSTTTAMGADLRTASGLGTLQLVSPFMVRVKSQPPDCGGCVNQWYYAGIASAEVQFVPEPSTNAALAAGLATLAVLVRWSKRRERRLAR